MTDSANGLLEVDGLRIEFRSGRETVYAVNGAGFQVAHDAETNFPIFHPRTAGGEVLQ